MLRLAFTRWPTRSNRRCILEKQGGPLNCCFSTASPAPTTSPITRGSRSSSTDKLVSRSPACAPPRHPDNSAPLTCPPRRRLRCLRGAYHASRSVAQLLSLLLGSLAAGEAPQPPTERNTDCPSLASEWAELQRGLVGVPPTLQHEGPLRDAHLITVRDHATNDAVSHFRKHLCGGSPSPTPTSHLWTPGNTRAYQKALLAARQARLDEGGTFSGYQHLREAGAITRQTMCNDTQDAFAAAEWRRLIRCYTAFLPDRSHIHELENLPQEVAIGELLRDAVAAVQREGTAAAPPAFALDCVVDVGGGNGFLAAQVAERLQCDGVVIDPFFPAHAIDCCPRVWPDTAHRTHAAVPRRQTLHRTMALFRDVRWRDVVPAAPSRTALIAKHLCGSGVDEVLQRLEAQDCLPRVLVLAPCCFNKISFETYCNPDYLRHRMGIESESALARVHRLTDWNMSCYQSTQEAILAAEEEARRRHSGKSTATAHHASDGCSSSSEGRDVLTGNFAYQRRSGPRSIANSITCTHAFALLVEGLLNDGRIEWLQQRGYTVRLVQYVPDVVTPKNKCIVAIRSPRAQQ